MKHKILVTSHQMIDYLMKGEFQSDFFEMLPFEFDCRRSLSEKYTSSEMLGLLDSHVGIIVGDDQIDESVLLRSRQLKLVIKWGTGTDSIDVSACNRLGIEFANTPRILGDSVADLAITLFLTVIRQSNLIDSAIRKGTWLKRTGYEARSFHCGIIGFGTIGREIGKRLNGFSCKVSYFDPYCQEVDFYKFQRFNSLDDLMRSCNAIFVCVPLNDSTLQLLSRDEIKKLQSGSVLINISRGKVIDEFALIELLESGHLLGAGLDVFDIEPLPSDSTLFNLKNVVLSSHNGSNTFESVKRVSEKCLQILFSYFRDK